MNDANIGQKFRKIVPVFVFLAILHSSFIYLFFYIFPSRFDLGWFDSCRLEASFIVRITIVLQSDEQLLFQWTNGNPKHWHCAYKRQHSWDLQQSGGLQAETTCMEFLMLMGDYTWCILHSLYQVFCQF